jgi:hypothetical protein
MKEAGLDRGIYASFSKLISGIDVILVVIVTLVIWGWIGGLDCDVF